MTVAGALAIECAATSQPVARDATPHAEVMKAGRLRHHIQPGCSPAGVWGDSCTVGRSFMQSLGKRTH